MLINKMKFESKLEELFQSFAGINPEIRDDIKEKVMVLVEHVSIEETLKVIETSGEAFKKDTDELFRNLMNMVTN